MARVLFDLDRDAPRADDKKPDLVQRFVDASVIGWYHYLYGDNAPATATDQEGLIRKCR